MLFISFKGVTDPQLFLAALSDFLLTIISTMSFGQRPPQPNGNRGSFCQFEEGILCQRSSVFPGLEAKVSTGECAGWFAAIMAIVRRLIMKDQDFARDTSTTMQKTSINVKYVDQEKAIVILEALRDFESCVANTNLDNRMKVPAGKIVSDFIYEAAALIKRMFVPYTRKRQDMANELFDDALESSRCFYRLGSARGLTVLRFCQNCREGQLTTIRFRIFSKSTKRRPKPNISLNLSFRPRMQDKYCDGSSYDKSGNVPQRLQWC